MADAFTKAQFMSAPTYGGQGPVPLGAVKAGYGVEILADGTINATQGGGTVSRITPTIGIQGGGTGPEVFLGLLPPTATAIGGVKTIEGSGISIDNEGVIRSTASFSLSAGLGITVTNTSSSSAVASLKFAGLGPSQLGGVYVPASSGLVVAADGELNLKPATISQLGGIRPGVGCSVDNGVLNCTGTGGTITGVGAGTGLGGGGTSGAVTLFLRPANTTTIGGVKPGENVTIDPDGTLNVTSGALGVLTVSGTSPITIGGTPTNPIVEILDASVVNRGSVQLYDGFNSTSTAFAATANAVKQTYDFANTKLSLGGGSMTGVISFFGGQTFPGTVSTLSYTGKGAVVAGTGAGTIGTLTTGSNGQVLSVDTSSTTGLRWVNAGTGSVTDVTGTYPVTVTDGQSTPDISIAAATTATPGIVQLYNGVDSTSATLVATAAAVKTAFDTATAAAANSLPLSGGTMTGDIVFTPTQQYTGVLQLGGGTMTGNITFAGTQTFPGVLAQGVLSGTAPISIGGTAANPIIQVDKATLFAAGIVQPDGISIVINGQGVISTAASTGTLQTVTNAGATTNKTITVAGLISSGLTYPFNDGTSGQVLTTNGTGDLTFQDIPTAGLLTTSAAATTYAPLDSPTLTGPVIVNAGGATGSNALTVSGGNLVLSTQFTPSSSSDTGSVGEIAWDNSGYLYVCYQPNTWGRVQIDLTPF